MKKPKLTSIVAAALMVLAPLVSLAQTANTTPVVIEDLQCRGNEATSCGFILRYLYLERGDVLDEVELRNAQLRLSTLHMFESVTVFLERGSQRGKTVVVIQVVESNPLGTEWLQGASYHIGRLRSVTAGRLTDSNLLGSGKFADLAASTVQPLNGTTDPSYAAALRYVDPHLFDSRRFFGVVSANYVDSHYEDRYGNFDDVNSFTLLAALGWRFGAFSYLTFDYGYRLHLDEHYGVWHSDGTFELHEGHNRHAVNVNYGWSSEDDFYFPTHGSSFRTGFGWGFGSSAESNAFHISYRKTWPLGDGFASVKLGENPSSDYRQALSEDQSLSVSYGEAISPGDFVRRGRWYFAAGADLIGFKENGQRLVAMGLKFGIRVETSTLGLIDLYVLAAEADDQ